MQGGEHMEQMEGVATIEIIEEGLDEGFEEFSENVSLMCGIHRPDVRVKMR